MGFYDLKLSIEKRELFSFGTIFNNCDPKESPSTWVSSMSKISLSSYDSFKFYFLCILMSLKLIRDKSALIIRDFLFL